MNIFNPTPKETPELLRLRKENEELRNTIHSILAKQESSNELEDKIVGMTAKLSEMAKEEQRIEDFLKTFYDEKVEKSKAVFELNRQMSELTQQKILLEDNIKSVEATNNSLLKKKEASESHISELLLTIRLNESKVAQLETKLDKLNETDNKLKDEIASEEDRVTILKGISSDLTTEIKEHKKTLLTLENKIEEKEKIKIKSEYDSERINESLELLETKKETFTKELEELEYKITIIRDEYSTLSDQLKRGEEIRSKMQSNVAELVSELNLKEKLFKEYDAKKDNFINDISQKRNELDNIKFEIKNRNETLHGLGKEIEILIKQKNEIETNIKNNKNILDEISRGLIRKKEEESSFEEQLNDLKNNILDFEEKKFRTEESILQLESSFSDTTKKFAEEINESKSKLTSIKQLIIEKDRDFNEKEKIFLERNTQLSEYTGMVRLFKKEKESLENSLNELKKEKGLLNESIVSLKEKESASKMSVEKYRIEVQDLIKKREDVSYELAIILDKNSEAFSEYHYKNELLTREIEEKESKIKELVETINKIELTLAKLADDKAKAELEKEERSTNISQLITMEKTFKGKVNAYKKELERIEDETFIETIVQNVKINRHKSSKKNIELENN